MTSRAQRFLKATKPTELFDLEITKVDRVARGSNPGSVQTLFKSADEDGEPEFVMVKTEHGFEKLSFSEQHRFLQSELRDNLTGFPWIMAVDPDESIVVFESEGDLFAVSYTRNGDDFTLVGDPFQVVTEYRRINKQAPQGAATQKGQDMTKPVTKDGDANPSAEDLAKQVEELTKANATLTTERDDAVTEAAKAADVAKAAEAAETDPVKSALAKASPELAAEFERLQKSTAESQALVISMQNDNLTEGFQGIAKTYGYKGDDITDIGSVLQLVAKYYAEDSSEAKTITRVLKASAAQMETAQKILTTTGGIDNAASATGSAYARLNQLAKDYVKIHPDVTPAMAKVEVSKANPELVKETYADQGQS